MALFAEPKVRAHCPTAGLTRLDVNLRLAQDTQAEWPLWLHKAEEREPGPGCACPCWCPPERILGAPWVQRMAALPRHILVTGWRPSSRLHHELAALPRGHPSPRWGYKSLGLSLSPRPYGIRRARSPDTTVPCLPHPTPLLLSSLPESWGCLRPAGDPCGDTAIS